LEIFVFFGKIVKGLGGSFNQLLKTSSAERTKLKSNLARHVYVNLHRHRMDLAFIVKSYPTGLEEKPNPFGGLPHQHSDTPIASIANAVLKSRTAEYLVHFKYIFHGEGGTYRRATGLLDRSQKSCGLLWIVNA